MSINHKQRSFIESYLETMNATKSAQAAGYSLKTAYSIGQRLLKNVEIKTEIENRLNDIHEGQRRSFIVLSDMAVMALKDVVQNGRGLAKVNAANSILDRAGHKPIERTHAEVNANVKADMNINDARLELAEKFDRNFPIEEGTPSENNELESGSGESVTE